LEDRSVAKLRSCATSQYDALTVETPATCIAIGLPTVTVDAEQMENLLRRVESNPQSVFTIDLESKTLAFGEGGSAEINLR
jgi:hypothetical protein